MPADGGDAEQITRHGGNAALVSPDGQHLYYRRANAGAIFRIRTDGTGDTEIVPSAYATLTYAVTQSGLWFVGYPDTRSADPHWSIQLRRFSDGTTTEVARVDRPDGLQLSVSPDERYVLLTRLDSSGTDLQLVNDFR